MDKTMTIKQFSLFYAGLMSLFIIPQLNGSHLDRHSELNTKRIYSSLDNNDYQKMQDLFDDPHSTLNISFIEKQDCSDRERDTKGSFDPFSTSQLHHQEPNNSQPKPRIRPTETIKKIIFIQTPSQRVAEAIKKKNHSFFNGHKDQLEIAVPYYMYHADDPINDTRNLAINALEIMKITKKDGFFGITIDSAITSTKTGDLSLKTYIATIMMLYDRDQFPEGTSFKKTVNAQAQLLLQQLQEQSRDFKAKKQKHSLESLKVRADLLNQYLKLAPKAKAYKKDLERVLKAIAKHKAAEDVKSKKEELQKPKNEDLEGYLQKLNALLEIDPSDKKIQEHIKTVKRTLGVLRPIKTINDRKNSLFIDGRISSNIQDARTVMNNIITLANNIELAEEEDIQKIQQLASHPLLQQIDSKTYSLTFYPQNLVNAVAACFPRGFDKLSFFQQSCQKIHDHYKNIFHFPVPYRMDTEEMANIIDKIKTGNFTLGLEERILAECFPKHIPALKKEQEYWIDFVNQNQDIISILQELRDPIVRLEKILNKETDPSEIKSQSEEFVGNLRANLESINRHTFKGAPELQARAKEKAAEITKLLGLYEAKINPVIISKDLKEGVAFETKLDQDPSLLVDSKLPKLKQVGDSRLEKVEQEKTDEDYFDFANNDSSKSLEFGNNLAKFTQAVENESPDGPEKQEMLKQIGEQEQKTQSFTAPDLLEINAEISIPDAITFNIDPSQMSDQELQSALEEIQRLLPTFPENSPKQAACGTAISILLNQQEARKEAKKDLPPQISIPTSETEKPKPKTITTVKISELTDEKLQQLLDHITTRERNPHSDPEELPQWLQVKKFCLHEMETRNAFRRLELKEQLDLFVAASRHASVCQDKEPSTVVNPPSIETPLQAMTQDTQTKDLKPIPAQASVSQKKLQEELAQESASWKKTQEELQIRRHQLEEAVRRENLEKKAAGQIEQAQREITSDLSEDKLKKYNELIKWFQNEPTKSEIIKNEEPNPNEEKRIEDLNPQNEKESSTSGWRSFIPSWIKNGLNWFFSLFSTRSSEV